MMDGRKIFFATAFLLLATTGVTALTSTDTRSYRDHELILIGEATEQILWTDAYRASLYASESAADRAEILTAPTPKLLSIRLLTSDLPKTMPEDWEETFRRHLDPRGIAAVRDVYAQLEAGDTISFGFSPEFGTDIVVNGKTVASYAGYALMYDLLELWIGDDGWASERLRSEIAPQAERAVAFSEAEPPRDYYPPAAR